MATAKASTSANKRNKTNKAAKAKSSSKASRCRAKGRNVAEKESNTDPQASAAKSRAGFLTKSLGLEGWERLEPVILASLASEEPMLLVGRHGAAKSFLLERLAEALGLEFRFYNASLVNFDDLV